MSEYPASVNQSDGVARRVSVGVNIESDDHREPPESGFFAPLIDDAIVLTGPTAAGKSAVAVALAEQLGAEILSLDSIAVYRGMDVGTAKPSTADRQRVRHHLIDLVEPNEDFSVACYLRAAHQAVQETLQRGRRPIFVGGSPMFLKGVLRGFDPGPPADWGFRKAVEADIEKHGLQALHQRLRQVDPLAAHRIAASDGRRMIRALEVARQTGIPISHRQLQFDQERSAESCNVFLLMWPRERLHQRINARVDQMFEAGLVTEIRRLLENYRALSRTASQAVGYREVIRWLAAGGNLRQADQLGPELQSTIQEVAAHTRQMARRQETWFRSFTEIRRMNINGSFDPNVIASRIVESLV